MENMNDIYNIDNIENGAQSGSGDIYNKEDSLNDNNNGINNITTIEGEIEGRRQSVITKSTATR